jgi:hypothetical protein
MAGKGDKYREVDRDKFNSNWDDIFGKNKEEIPEEAKVTARKIIKGEISFDGDVGAEYKERYTKIEGEWLTEFSRLNQEIGDYGEED